MEKLSISKHWRVLVFPGGTENGIEIFKSLAYTKEVELFSVSDASKNHAEFIFKNHFVIPNVNDKKCLEELNEIILSNSIDFIFPANSIVIDFLIKYRTKLGCRVVLPKNESVLISRSKKATYRFFQDLLSIPILYENEHNIQSYPVFIKPDTSYGSKGALQINSKEHLLSLKIEASEYVICEYLPGDEFTIECFSSRNKGLIYSMARTRERIRMGTSMRSQMANDSVQIETRRIAQIISSKLELEGLWFFQMKYNKKGILTLLEIETRVAGTMAFSRCMGVNLPLANLYLLENIEVNLIPQYFDLIIDRSLNNKFKSVLNYEKVYIDLDDTIILKGKVNLNIIKFLYHCLNQKIKLILISKSLELDKEAFLEKHKILQLFDEFIWLKESESKADFIDQKSSIFIDDSFSQRIEVQEKLGIPTFDPSMIEMLMNETI